MCKVFSCVLLKNRIIWDIEEYKHFKLLENLGIKNVLLEPDFVKIEYFPKEGCYYSSRNKDDFRFVVDQVYIPDWFVEEVDRKRVEELYFSITKSKKGLNKLYKTMARQSGWTIQYIKNPSIKIQELAVRQNGEALKFIKNPGVKIQELAVKQGVDINEKKSA